MGHEQKLAKTFDSYLMKALPAHVAVDYNHKLLLFLVLHNLGLVLSIELSQIRAK